ncbi:hypothetical protein BT96DRAFT_163364 [Gymnopus androsaceus JB14]|uniref:Uncharacterized protein n=1 Tax=Gymnopus androsaceus JB14 TaxID=1447944 RepID=A0A6A4HA24_9AGAR|nr:hypothetical protein BT96DRAFT_163364 [Gymnopus androsaceus JB14]
MPIRAYLCVSFCVGQDSKKSPAKSNCVKIDIAVPLKRALYHSTALPHYNGGPMFLLLCHLPSPPTYDYLGSIEIGGAGTLAVHQPKRFGGHRLHTHQPAKGMMATLAPISKNTIALPSFLHRGRSHCCVEPLGKNCDSARSFLSTSDVPVWIFVKNLKWKSRRTLFDS